MSIASIMNGFAQQNGLSFDKDTLSIFGSYNGHNICLSKSAEGNMFNIMVNVKEGSRPPLTPLQTAFEQMKVDSAKRLVSYTAQKSKLTFKTSASFAYSGLTKNVDLCIQQITNYLNENGYVDCCYECNGETGLEINMINSDTFALCGGCYEGVLASLEANKQNIKQKKGNMLTGIIGALLGSLIGVVVFVLIGQLGYIAAISGIVMAICTLKGYELMGGKISAPGVIVSCAIMAVMVWFSCSLDFSISIAAELDAGVFEVFRVLPELFGEISELFASFIGNLAIAYLLTAVGAVPTIIGMFKQKTGHYSTKKLTYAGPAVEGTAVEEKGESSPSI